MADARTYSSAPFPLSLLLPLLLLLFLTEFVRAVPPPSPSPSPSRRQPDDRSYQSLVQGLYDANDNVTVLRVDNFRSSVYRSDRGWLVQFYNSWCGFCFRFAPVWKSFADQVFAWRDMVAVAAVDCADDDNNPLCREYEIMHYPMLKYFPVRAPPSSFGLVVEKYDAVDKLVHALVRLLESEQQQGRGLPSWPNLAPYRNYDTADLWKSLPDAVRYFFLLFERNNDATRLGARVILSLRDNTALRIRRVTSDNEFLRETNKVARFPTLIVFTRNETRGQSLPISIPTAEGVVDVVQRFLASKPQPSPPLVQTAVAGDPRRSSVVVSAATPVVAAAAGVTTTTTITHANSVNDDNHDIDNSDDDRLYRLDLESALRYSIGHEIPSHKNIDGQKMNALKNYLAVLADHFPLSRTATIDRHGSPLSTIRDILRSKDSISGREFARIVHSSSPLLRSQSHLPPKWIGCKGSREGLRGYPCGLWTLFHYLTVAAAGAAAATTATGDDHHPPKTTTTTTTPILEAIHGYVRYFFGCADCVQHFLRMASEHNIFDASNVGEGAVLWLWSAHNRVNARLSGDDTEDPKHKKVQYPPTERCSDCKYPNGTWNRRNVFAYLRTKYGREAIVDYPGSSPSIRLDDKTTNPRTIDDHRFRRDGIQSKRSNKYSDGKKIGWDFTLFDISICVILYVASAVILVLVCVKFAVKRTYRKKQSYVGLLLG